MAYEVAQVDDDLRHSLGLQSIGFLKIRSKGEVIDPECSGSGTLVRLPGGRRGILTAAHVVDEVRKNNPVGIQHFTVEGAHGQMKVTFHESDYFVASGWGKGKDVPDLGFIRLCAPEIASLEARGCLFYDLEKPRPVTDDYRAGRSANYVVGVVGESMRQSISEFSNGPIFSSTLLFLLSVNGLLHTDEHLTLTQQIPIHGEGNLPPNSYAGMSGGGLWMVSWGERCGETQLDRKLLGVVFQERPDDEGNLSLIGHGLPDVFRYLLPEVERGLVARAGS